MAARKGSTKNPSDDEEVREQLLQAEIPTETIKMSAETSLDSAFDSQANESMKNGNTTDTIHVTISSDSLAKDIDGMNYDAGPWSRFIAKIETAVGEFAKKYGKHFSILIKIVLLLAYGAYFSYCMYYRFGDEGSIILLIGTSIFVFYLAKKLLANAGYSFNCPQVLVKCTTSRHVKKIQAIIRYGLYIAVFAGLCLFLGLEVLKDNPQNGRSILGIAAIILVCFILSTRPSRINWHPVFWGFIIQFVFATLTLRTEFGYQAFKWLGDLVQTFMGFSDYGSAFVLTPDFMSMGLAFQSSGVIIFFNSMIFLLNHWGVLEIIIVRVGYALSWCLDTGPVESVIAVANIFMGLSEAPLLIRPYLPTMSKSELCAVMTCGFASVSGGIMGMFIVFGAPANHLLTAAVISAPAALAISKIMCPETETMDLALQKNITMQDEGEKQNALSAASDGAVKAVVVVASIMANMLAFVSILNLIDSILDWFGERAGVSGLTFDFICSYILYPLAYAMGAEPEDCGRIGSLIGIKLFATPFVGYAELGKIIQNRFDLEEYVATSNGTWQWQDGDIVLGDGNRTLINGVISERSEVISTYAMCGFSAFTAIGICIGTLVPMSPSRKQDIISLVMTAFIAGNMASFATGAVAGLMFTGSSSQPATL